MRPRFLPNAPRFRLQFDLTLPLAHPSMPTAHSHVSLILRRHPTLHLLPNEPTYRRRLPLAKHRPRHRMPLELTGRPTIISLHTTALTYGRVKNYKASRGSFVATLKRHFHSDVGAWNESLVPSKTQRREPLNSTVPPSSGPG